MPELREVLLASLGSRIIAYLTHRDPSALLAEQALVEAKRLLEADQASSDSGGAGVDAVCTVAWLHWCLCAALPRGQGVDHLQIALDLFAAIEPVDPALVPDDASGRPGVAAALATAILRPVLRVDDQAAEDHAINLLRGAVDELSADHRNRVDYLLLLGRHLHKRFVRAGIEGDLVELNAAVNVLNQAVEATATTERRARAGRLSMLGAALMTRFERLGDDADMETASAVFREAVEVAPANLPGRALHLANLCALGQARFIRSGHPADLDAAINAGREAAEATPSDHQNWPGYLANLGNALRHRFERIGQRSDLDEATTVLRRAVDATPIDHPDRVTNLHNLGLALEAGFDRFGDPVDLDAAVSVLRLAVEAAPAVDPSRASYLTALGNVLQVRFERFGNLADLDGAIDIGREAVEAAPDSPARARSLSDLGNALRLRFERHGDSADVDVAIAALRKAVETTPAAHRRAMYLANLGLALESRFDVMRDLADLNAAIAALRKAVDLTPTSHPDRAMYQNNLGNSLQSRFRELEGPADLEAAINAGREAVDATPADFPDRASYLSNFGNSLRARFKRAGDLADLNAAIAVLREAVQATPVGHPGRSVRMHNLGAAHRSRFERVGDPADLDYALSIAREALDATPANHPDRVRRLHNLGLALRARFKELGDRADARAALRMWQEAAAIETASTSLRMNAAEAWGELAASAGDWSTATDGYAKAVALLPLLTWRGVSRGSRERLLADRHGLATNAAACAIAAGRLEHAVELLESGRAVLWSQLLETRTDVTALREAHPELAARLDAARAALDRPAVGLAPEVEARLSSAREWDMLIGQVRDLPGFDEFARPPTAARLRQVATEGAIVVINISPWRCDALLITDNTISVKPLRDLTEDLVVEQTNNYLLALQEFQSTKGDPQAARTILERSIIATLEWLWDSVAKHVLAALGYHSAPDIGRDWPRLWWCPTGALTLLPIHAAGYHGEPDGRSVLDRVISSYTPTIRALFAARTRTESSRLAQLLHIAIPDTPGQAPLPNVAAEQALLTRLFNESKRTALAGRDATHANIVNGLASHAWAHVSCHGYQSLTDPATGGLVPYDWDTAGLVGLLDLTTTEHTGGEFAFLSACKTAVGGVATLDEAISLASALHFAGWRHVVGTLWSVWDDAAADITAGTYTRLVGGGHLEASRTAQALHDALREYRDRPDHRNQPSRWAPFLHSGP
jgi:tetratricopeptide (TPR) repeat protein